MAESNALGSALLGIQSFDGTSVYAGRTLTAGNNISITNGDGVSGNPIISSSSSILFSYTDVNSSPYVVGNDDFYLSVDTSSSKIIQLPNSPSTGRVFVIKDRNGNSSANNITITTVGGAVTIDGETSVLILNDYDALNFLFNGSSYEIW